MPSTVKVALRGLWKLREKVLGLRSLPAFSRFLVLERAKRMRSTRGSGRRRMNCCSSMWRVRGRGRKGQGTLHGGEHTRRAGWRACGQIKRGDSKVGNAERRRGSTDGGEEEVGTLERECGRMFCATFAVLSSPSYKPMRAIHVYMLILDAAVWTRRDLNIMSRKLIPRPIKRCAPRFPPLSSFKTCASQICPYLVPHGSCRSRRTSHEGPAA